MNLKMERGRLNKKLIKRYYPGEDKNRPEREEICGESAENEAYETEYEEKDYRELFGLSDEDIAQKAASGEYVAIEYILTKYKNFVKNKARSYFIIGADKEDIVQEGMIGLYKAVRDFKGDKNVSFRAFADVCVTRQIITAIKAATRLKHQPLNSYVSLNRPVYDDESEKTLVDIIQNGKLSNPEEIIIDNEELASMENKMGEMMSKFEKQVLELYLQGQSYSDIAKMLDKPAKSIDNALQRIKGKLDKYICEKQR